MSARMNVKFRFAGLVGLGLSVGLGGCVSQQHYDRLEMQYRAAADRNSTLARENEQLQSALSLQGNANSGTQSTLGQLRDENARLRDELAKNNELLLQLDGDLRNLDLMDPATDRALRELANRHPNLLTYDSQLGMLRFASDLTFNSGSDQLRDEASTTLASLADVLKSQDAAKYELHIVGHTDSQQISSGTAQRHPTNTHLSAHRAISVKQRLASLGIPTGRLMVAGWGESRPVMTNSASGNTPANRRVEIYFRAERGASGSAVTNATVDTQRSPERPLDPVK